MKNTDIQKKSSLISIHHHNRTPEKQFKLPTWGALIILILILIILKKFIYIKDGPRDGK